MCQNVLPQNSTLIIRRSWMTYICRYPHPQSHLTRRRMCLGWDLNHSHKQEALIVPTERWSGKRFCSSWYPPSRCALFFDYGNYSDLITASIYYNRTCYQTHFLALWELPELGEDMGVFLWRNHKNTPIYPLFHGDSQRPKNLSNWRVSRFVS